MSLSEGSAAPWVTSPGTNAVTSASFTPAASALVVASGGIGNGNGNTTTGITITDSVGGSWTVLATKFNSPGASSILAVKDAGASPSAQTVTLTGAGATVTGAGLIVRQFTGAAPAASQTGAAVATGVAASEPYTQAITPTTTGSQVVGAYSQSTGAVSLTANGSTTIYGQVNGTNGDTECAFEASALSTASVPVTVGFTNTGTTSATFSVAEILPAPATAASAPASIRPGPAWTAKFRRNLICRIPAIPPSLATTLSINVTDAGNAAESLVVATTLPDTGTGAETVSTALTLADAGSGAETAPVKLTLPDSGSGAESLTVKATFTDAGTGIESLSTMFTLSDTGSAAETFTVTIMLADTGSSSETLPAATAITDSGSAADSLTGIPPALADSGSSAEALIVAVILRDSGTGTEILSSAFSFTITDHGSGLDTGRATASISATDTGSAQDSLARIIAASDAGAAAEGIGIRFNAQISEHQYNLDHVSVTGRFLPSAADNEHLTDTVRITVKIKRTDTTGLHDAPAMTERVVLREQKMLTDRAQRIETVESSVVCRWRVRTSVSQSFVTEWNVRKQVSQSVIVRWDVIQILAVTTLVMFDVLQSVTAGPLIVEWYTGKAVQEYVPLVPRSAWRSTYPGNRSVPKSPWQSTYGK